MESVVWEKLLFFIEYIGLDKGLLKGCRIVVMERADEKSIYCLHAGCSLLYTKLFSVSPLLKIREPGVYMGRMHKDRFEPSLELGGMALAYSRRHGLKLRGEIALDYERALEFTHGKPVILRAQEIPCGRSPSLVPATYDGFFLGWGRLRGSRVYPLLDVGMYIRRGD